MKQTVLILILQLFMVVSMNAQGQQKFSAEKFDADMEKFNNETEIDITNTADDFESLMAA